MKRIYLLLASLILPLAALAVQISVPSAPGANYVLLSTTTGAYNYVATSSLGISGGGGTPGGSNTQVQFNNSGAFGGDSFLTHNTNTGQTTLDAFSYTSPDLASASFVSYDFTAGTLDLSTGYSYNFYNYVNTPTLPVYSATPQSVIVPIPDIQGVASGAINYGESGYTADGTTWNFRVYPIYGALISPNYATVSVTDDGSSNPYGIDFTITPPSNTVPDNYFIVRLNDSATQVVAGSFVDNNGGWGSTSLPALIAGYSNNLSISYGAGSSDGFRAVNIITGHSYTSPGAGTTITDNGSWTDVTTQPTSIKGASLVNSGGAYFSDVLSHTGAYAGFYDAMPITQPGGDVFTSLVSLGLVSSATLDLSELTGNLPLSRGGTGVSGFGANQMIFENAGATALSSFNDMLIGLKPSGQHGMTVGGTGTPNTTLDVQGDFAIRRGGSLNSTGTLNNVDVTNLSTLQLNGSPSVTITGFTPGYDGKFLYITNLTGGDATLANQNTGSTAANRIVTPNGFDVIIANGMTAALYYDSSTLRWRVFNIGSYPAAFIRGAVSVTNGGTGTTTAFTKGSIVFATSSGAFNQDNSNFFWDSATHRLGIGTTTPAARLDIAGVLGSQTTLFNISSTTATNVVSSLFNVNANGNVGINNTSPVSKLTVTDGSGTANNPGQLRIGSSPNQSGGDHAGWLVLGDTGTTGAFIGIWRGGANSTAQGNHMNFNAESGFHMMTGGSFQFGAGGAGSEAFTIDGTNTNNVGVSTTTPFARLSVTGSAGNSAKPVFEVASSTNANLFSVDGAGHVATGGGTPALTSCGTTPAITGNDTSGQITFGTGALLTSCTVTFSVPMNVSANSKVHVFVNQDSGSLGIFAAQSVTTTGFVITTALSGATGDAVSYYVVLSN